MESKKKLQDFRNEFSELLKKYEITNSFMIASYTNDKDHIKSMIVDKIGSDEVVGCMLASLCVNKPQAEIIIRGVNEVLCNNELRRILLDKLTNKKL